MTSEPAGSGTASPAEERDWRSSRATSAVPSTDGDNSPRQQPAAPGERRKLALAPRSVPATPSSATSPDSAPSSAKSIFGAAKPIDTATREREAAAKMAARDAERKKAREEEAKREEDKAKKLSDDRARAIKEAQEKAMAAVSGRPAKPAAAPRQQSGGANAQGAKKRGPGQVGDDGFEQVAGKGARASAAAQDRPGQGTRKESTTRTGFSFAAAAGGIAGQDEDDEGKDGVEEIENGVKEVAV